MDGPARAGASGQGARHEQSLAARGVRKAMGAFYTPADVVEVVLDLALEPLLQARSAQGAAAIEAIRVIDPACGTGNFLVAAAHRIAGALCRAGIPEAQAWAHAAGVAVQGIDRDAEAVAVARRGLVELGGAGAGGGVVVGDALALPSLVAEGAFDVVVGNPPFLSQLGTDTARSAGEGAALRERFGASAGAYTDPAAVFLLLGARLARPDGGAVAMIEPISVLTAAGAAGVRSEVLALASLAEVWLVGELVFDAAVEVCVPVLRRGAPVGPVSLRHGRDAVGAGVADAPGPGAATWSSLLADHAGLPWRPLAVDGRLGDLASATADFRDQYYGLSGHVRDAEVADDALAPPLVTSGLIDPAWCAWGERSARFDKVAYAHPRVALEALAPTMAAWARSRLVPKVLLATQTRVPEAVVDVDGRWLPSVPVITVTGDPGRLWHLAAVLTCPAVAAEVARRHLGSGRNARAVRLRAREVLDLPLPADRARWDEAAAALRERRARADPDERRDGLARVGRLMDQAYGVDDDDELLAWWCSLVPVR